MNKKWLQLILFTSIILLALLKAQDVSVLNRFFMAEKGIKLKSFSEAKTKILPSEVDMLELWESILTGRAAPVSKIIKDRYRLLGLSHVFTPSGFHLSAVLNPTLKFFKNSKVQMGILLIAALVIYRLPGLSALKRMLTIKMGQQILSSHPGFIAGVLIDISFGTFTQNTLSFTYSFLFLGIIYSGLQGVALITWFFFAQMILAYFQESHISILLLAFSPILNLLFGLLMPILFLLAIPLWGWQLRIGLFLLKTFQMLVDFFATISTNAPSLEVNLFTLFIIACFLCSKSRLLLFTLFVYCNSLNLDYERPYSHPRKEFVPSGRILKTSYRESEIILIFSDGKCRKKLVRGYWWESCSPRRGSKKRTS